MKATLEFDLNDVDDKMAHMRAINATNMANVLWEIQMNLNKSAYRKIEALEAEGSKLDAYDGKQIVLDLIQELMEENGINDISLLIN